jgi:Fe-S cluster biosynthesis and repair protein YggX
VDHVKSYGKHESFKNGGKTMEQRLYLQMFADDAASTASDAKAGDNPAADAPADAPDKKTAGSDSQAKQTGKTYSDADVDKIIEKKFAEWQKKQEKAVSEAAKLAEMNAQEKAQTIRKEADAYRAEAEQAVKGMIDSYSWLTKVLN